MRMQVILDSSFARPGSAPIWGGKKGEFRDWTMVRNASYAMMCNAMQCFAMRNGMQFNAMLIKIYLTLYFLFFIILQSIW